jgi:hypothetical protein
VTYPESGSALSLSPSSPRRSAGAGWPLFMSVFVSVLAAGASCAKVDQGPNTSGSGGTHLPGTGSGGDTGSGGSAAFDGGVLPETGGIDKFEADMKTCTDVKYMFTPMIPTVTLLVDRSGSMFHCLSGSTGDAVCADMTNTSWYNLKMAIESVITHSAFRRSGAPTRRVAACARRYKAWRPTLSRRR